MPKFIYTLLFTGLLYFACTSTTSNRHPTNNPPPNIILLIGDDQGYPYFGFMGADYVQTPNMDALAASGMVFTQGYVPSNHCRPSLQSLLTGTLPIDYQRTVDSIKHEQSQTRRFPDKEAKEKWEKDFDFHAMQYFETLPKLLAQKGYKSFQGGKWWEFHYKNGGFTHGMTKGWTEEEQKTAGWFEKFMGGQGMDLARVTNQPAYDFLDTTKGHPFFMWFAPSLPHYPFDAPEKYYNIYKDKDMSESAKQYYANCTWFDDAWGALVAHLKEKGLYDNTLIVYVNDNGWEQEPQQEFWDDPMRSHNGGDKGKGSIFDMSFRTPILFAWADEIEAGKRSSALMHSADIPATILDYAGIDLPSDMHGKSYRPVIEGKQSSIRKSIVGNVVTVRSKDPKNVMGDHVAGFWLREGNWFLKWIPERGLVQLFDVEKDPRNDVDVAAEQAALVEGFLEKIHKYRAAKGVDRRLVKYGVEEVE